MITVEKETAKRLEIIEFIKKGLEDIVECIVLGGSMGYGQNYSVAPWSDIDTVVVIDKNKVDKLMKHPYFNQTVSPEIIQLFANGKIDFFWSSRFVSRIQVDIFVYNKISFIDFCLLRKGISGFIKSKPSETQKTFNFEGKEVLIHRKVTPHKEGFIFTKPALNEGFYWGGVPRDDFLFMNYIIYDKEEFYQNLTKQVWATLATQLKKEHGPKVDLEKYNILNSIFTYQTNRQGLPKETIQKIKFETEDRLRRLIV